MSPDVPDSGTCFHQRVDSCSIPASDLYALGRCMVYGAGGDPTGETLPPRVPEPLARFIRFFLKPSPVQRPQDAWEMYHTLERTRDELFGPHRFVEFRVDP